MTNKVPLGIVVGKVSVANKLSLGSRSNDVSLGALANKMKCEVSLDAVTNKVKCDWVQRAKKCIVSLGAVEDKAYVAKNIIG